jgi:hypothetical protein
MIHNYVFMVLVHKLEDRFSSKPKFSYSWKGISAGLAGLEAIDKFGHGLFSDPWVATSEPLAPAPVNSKTEGQGIAPSPSPAHELALSPVYLNVFLEMLQVLKETNAKLDILISRG